MTIVLWTALVMLICLLVEGFFSGSEIGLVSADRNKLRHEVAKGSRGTCLANAGAAGMACLLYTSPSPRDS